jgi:hypothetical protein
LADAERARIVQCFAELPKPLQSALIDAAWRTLSDGLKGQTLRLVDATATEAGDG